jgi:lipopolysaccharide export LptBFGC system permease protein LptF
MHSVQEKRSVASLYVGTILGALSGVIGNFFVSFWFQPQSWSNFLGLAFSFIMLFFVCVALFLQAKKYSE